MVRGSVCSNRSSCHGRGGALMADTKLQTWQSPHTGTVYSVYQAITSRVDYAEPGNPKSAYTRVAPRYDFYGPEGNRVTYSYDMDEQRLHEHFAYVEGVYDANLVNSRFD